MRFCTAIAILLVSLMPICWAARGQAEDFYLGPHAGDEGLRSFHLSIGEYYRVQPREIVIVRDRIHDEDELPVVFFIAKHARVKPAVIIKMRESGQSWMSISRRFGLGPDIYYYALPRHPFAGPYGRAYEHFKRDRRSWKHARLDDSDIVNLINLRYMSEHYGCPPERIIQLRSEGNRFSDIYQEIRFGKAESRVQSASPLDLLHSP